MMFVGTSREKFFYHNTLLCLVKSLQDKNITVDLRNDSYVCGQLTSVDGYMNISMSKAVYCDSQENEYYFDNLFVQARNIRYVHIPETISILGNIKNEFKKGNEKDPNKEDKPVKSRKAKKALQQHMKIVASLEN
nr:U7 snRNA-associated Sm-like protein LSm10 [Vanessa tameamea]